MAVLFNAFKFRNLNGIPAQVLPEAPKSARDLTCKVDEATLLPDLVPSLPHFYSEYQKW